MSSCGTSGDLDGEFDRTVRQLLLGDGMAAFASFQRGTLDGVCLLETVELDLIAPSATKSIELDAAVLNVADGGIAPTWQLDGEPSRRGAEQLYGSLHWARQTEPPASCADCDCVPDFRFDLYNVRHGVFSLYTDIWT
jgi:hypothetical protein